MFSDLTAEVRAAGAADAVQGRDSRKSEVVMLQHKFVEARV